LWRRALKPAAVADVVNWARGRSLAFLAFAAVVDAVRVPVVAAGGIADARGVAV